MPDKKAIARAKKDKHEGKSASTQAGEFVREEIEHVRKGRHGARSIEQAIAIGLSEARRAGVDLPAPKKGNAAAKAIKRAKRDLAMAGRKKTASGKSRKRGRASTGALKREKRTTVSKTALARHARTAAHKRSAEERSSAARKAARTKGAAGRSAAARKAARTRAKNRKR
ncbi:MAG: hypothetical protein EPN40_01825 [Rhodanobacteraceae bacterium]|nr:MAG: hypothetical protein EPN40_01825 [Rhodanobacteraceae bacterium]